MRFQSVAVAAALGPVAAYAANVEAMDKLMELKNQDWEAAEARGAFAGSKLYKAITSFRPCINGKSGWGENTTYACNNVDMHGFLSHEDLASPNVRGNDVWGWTSSSGREFGIVGQVDGVAFVEIQPITGRLIYVGRLGTQTEVVSWRDVKVIGDHAYIGSEAADHGMQIFDLRKLLKVKPWWNPWFFRPKEFSIETDLTALYTGFGASHNIVAHPETNMIYSVGGRSGANGRDTECAGGLFMVDVSDPANPVSPGCVGQDGYTHDAQCVIYSGPSEKYNGHEICFAFNEDTVTVLDLTDKTNPVVVSRTPYEGSAYTHQGWLIDNTDMSWLLMDDELDERDNTTAIPDGRTTTYIFNVTNLEEPVHTGLYRSTVKSIDHNQYVVDGLSYQSNYVAGLRVLDVSGVEQDPTGGNFEEVGFFDCYPEDDAEGGSIQFLGSWSTYPFFKSGFILLNSIERGIFSLRYTGPNAKY